MKKIYQVFFAFFLFLLITPSILLADCTVTKYTMLLFVRNNSQDTIKFETTSSEQLGSYASDMSDSNFIFQPGESSFLEYIITGADSFPIPSQYEFSFPYVDVSTSNSGKLKITFEDSCLDLKVSTNFTGSPLAYGCEFVDNSTFTPTYGGNTPSTPVIGIYFTIMDAGITTKYTFSWDNIQISNLQTGQMIANKLANLLRSFLKEKLHDNNSQLKITSSAEFNGSKITIKLNSTKTSPPEDPYAGASNWEDCKNRTT